jgi:hypothetical protein
MMSLELRAVVQYVLQRDILRRKIRPFSTVAPPYRSFLHHSVKNSFEVHREPPIISMTAPLDRTSTPQVRYSMHMAASADCHFVVVRETTHPISACFLSAEKQHFSLFGRVVAQCHRVPFHTVGAPRKGKCVLILSVVNCHFAVACGLISYNSFLIVLPSTAPWGWG